LTPYTVEVLPDDAIILEVWGKDFEVSRHGAQFLSDLIALLDTANAPMANIVDMRQTSLGVDDVILGANLGTRLTGFSKHPRLRKSIFVTNSRIVALAARGLNSPIFGNAKVFVAATVEEAMAMARQ
jgi:hypothetical protein